MPPGTEAFGGIWIGFACGAIADAKTKRLSACPPPALDAKPKPGGSLANAGFSAAGFTSPVAVLSCVASEPPPRLAFGGAGMLRRRMPSVSAAAWMAAPIA